MAYKPRFNSKRREVCWHRACAAARMAGLGSLPICNIPGCGRVVQESDDWDESHDPGRHKVFGGRETGVAHRACNREHGAQVVVPEKAKADRIRRKHIGAARKGTGPHPMPGGHRANFKIAIGGGRKPRLTVAEALAATREKLTLKALDGTPIGVWASDPPLREH